MSYIGGEFDLLLSEYRHSIGRLKSLDPSLPPWMQDIRAKYRDYIAEELAARGLDIREHRSDSQSAARARPRPVERMR